MIVNEIFRRVHPEGKTMGEYLRDEFAPAHGLDGLIIGMKKEEISRKVPFETVGGFTIMKEIIQGPNKKPTIFTYSIMN